MILLPLALTALSFSQQDTVSYEPYVAPASDEAALSSAAFRLPEGFEIGRASCRERV